jgi:hypothetical protein
MWFIETEQHTLKKHPESYFRAACEQQGRWDTTEQHTECESRTPLTDSNNKQSRDGRNVSERNLNETRKIHPKVINLSKRNLKESEVKLLKNGLKFTPTPNEDKTLLGADIDVFCRRLRINYIFNGNEEDEDDDIGGPLVRNKSDWIPKPTKDKYLEESINTLKSNSLETNKHVKDNLCRNERQALFRLKSDKSIVIKEV